MLRGKFAYDRAPTLKDRLEHATWFAAVAATLIEQGPGVIGRLAYFMASVYIGLALLWVVLWWAFYHNPEKHPNLGKAELALIQQDNEAPPVKLPFFTALKTVSMIGSISLAITRTKNSRPPDASISGKLPPRASPVFCQRLTVAKATAQRVAAACSSGSASSCTWATSRAW